MVEIYGLSALPAFVWPLSLQCNSVFSCLTPLAAEGTHFAGVKPGSLQHDGALLGGDPTLLILRGGRHHLPLQQLLSAISAP
jgi:hypothetical protein